MLLIDADSSLSISAGLGRQLGRKLEESRAGVVWRQQGSTWNSLFVISPKV
jgi:hypothetical protein